MKRINYILFILLCGFFLSPVDSYGCNSSEQTSLKKACCESNNDSQQDKEVEKSCCKKTKSEQKSCDGSCGNSNCSVTPVFTSIIPSFVFNNTVTTETIISKKVDFFYLEKNILTHYFSIWAPPKIS